MRRAALLAVLASLAAAGPAAARAATHQARVGGRAREQGLRGQLRPRHRGARTWRRTLTKAGQLLPNYFGTSHASLGNYITMISGQAAEPRHPGRLPALRGRAARDAERGRPDLRAGVRLSRRPRARWPTSSTTAGLRWRGYMEDMGNTPSSPRHLPAPARQRQRRHAGRPASTTSTRPPQPVRVLPRRSPTRPRATATWSRSTAAALGREARRDDSQLRVHHARPVQRRSRRDVRRRRPRRPAGGRPLPAPLGASHPGVSRLRRSPGC